MRLFKFLLVTFATSLATPTHTVIIEHSSVDSLDDLSEKLAASSLSKKAVTVHLSPGRHRGTLKLTQELHGHLSAVNIIGSSSSSSIISSGVTVTGWAEVQNPIDASRGNVLKAPVPPELISHGAGYTRELYVDDVRIPRTRIPFALQNLSLVNETEDGVLQHYSTSSHEDISWDNAGDVEFVYTGVASSWAEPRCSVESSDSESGIIKMKQPCFWNLVYRPFQPMNNAAPAFIENSKEALGLSPSSPTFYLDRNEGSIYLSGIELHAISEVVLAGESDS